MEAGRMDRRRRARKTTTVKPENVFLIIILFFGLLATFLTVPLTTGDEGYHLSKAYNLFSEKHPKVMSESVVRGLELETVNHIKQLNTEKLNLSNDKIKLNLKQDANSFMPFDLMHLPAAVGVLIGRLIYPSYVVMDYCGRLFNLIFFAVGFYFLIKRNKNEKWTLFMLFSVPFIQKMASPSYDVFCYLAISAYALNLFDLAKIKAIKQLSFAKILYTLLTILLIFSSKRNYVFGLTALLGLPLVYQPMFAMFKSLKKPLKVIGVAFATIVLVIALYLFNEKLHLYHFAKSFFNSYLNIETTGRRARQMWQIIPTTLPSFLNILWILALFSVMITEAKAKWLKGTIIIGIVTYLTNWVGIFGGFYRSRMTAISFDQLSGRYLSPFMIFFVPLLQKIGLKYNLNLPKNVLQRVAIVSTCTIMMIYLLFVIYRGFVLKINPTWTEVG
ncbi:MAG: DUF2142 domain-containing protein [Streptococcaceae bacterium]|jgi:hypothetical protein|nr:DUF2142 domain-containing protein [Streptococcaceae bacterium]